MTVKQTHRLTMVATVALIASALAGCGEKRDETPATAAALDLPAYCVASSDSESWALVESSCRTATDGDVEQARALRGELAALAADEVADFHRAFVRANHELRSTAVADAADAACAPGLGLGDDLFTDFRSWVIAHGEQVHQAVLDDPTVLENVPDLPGVCGLGEPYGAIANAVFAEKSGRPEASTGLPLLETY